MCTNPLIIVYDKGGTVEVYGECFSLIGLFYLLLLHVSKTSNLLMYIQKYKEWACTPYNGNHFYSYMLFGAIRFTRKWLNCTRLHLVKLPRHLLVKLYPNYTQKHVIIYTYSTLTHVISYCIPPPLTVHFPMTRSMRYQPILHTLYYTLLTEHGYCLSYRFFNNVVITTIVEMV